MTPNPAPPTRLHLLISGRVQGVGFRYAVLAEARRMGIRGWVRNTQDDGVELLAEGDASCLHRLVTWSHGGPPGALVKDVDARWLPATGEFDDFSIRR